MKTLVYLSYGEGLHVDEAIFSILSAQHWLIADGSRIRISVLTDTPERFAGLGVDVEPVGAQALSEWLGPIGYAHRRKLEAIKLALSKYGGAVALVDADTWFRRSPAVLFDHISAGKCHLHLRESKLIDSRTPTNLSLANFLQSHKFARRDGSRLQINPNSMMWNSGVIGLHASDIGKIDDALNLLDQFGPCASSVHTLEQFAISQALADMDLREAADIVFHYWPQRVRAPFRATVRDIVKNTQDLPLRERAAAIYSQRPKTTAARQLILQLKRLMQMIGIPVLGVRASG